MKIKQCRQLDHEQLQHSLLNTTFPEIVHLYTITFKVNPMLKIELHYRGIPYLNNFSTTCHFLNVVL